MRIWEFLKETFREWSGDRAPRMGAALAYYTVFSLAPVLVIAIGVAGIFFGQRTVEGRLMEEIRGLLGPEGADAIRAIIENAASDQSGGVLATLMGIAALIFGASGAFVELQDALTTIWDVKPKSRGLLGMLKDRFLSFTLVVGIGFLLLVSLVISAALAAIGSITGQYVSPLLLHGVNFVISFGVITVLFAMIFKILPDAKIAWRDVWLGAAVASLLFSAGKFAIGLYLGKSGMASAYGAAGSLVIVLVWVYYSAQILFLGAEFAQVYARWRGRSPKTVAEVAMAFAAVERVRRTWNGKLSKIPAQSATSEP
jgi:membrane protein